MPPDISRADRTHEPVRHGAVEAEGFFYAPDRRPMACGDCLGNIAIDSGGRALPEYGVDNE